MKRVLRLRPGDRVTLFDDAGCEHEATIRHVGDDVAELVLLSSAPAPRESPLDVALAVALTKGDKLEWVVEKATELGVKTMMPFVSRYSVPKLDGGRAAKRALRWRKIALNATKQCGRTRVPEIRDLVGFDELITQPPAAVLRVLLREKEAGTSLSDLCAARDNPGSVLLVIGPEGGFSTEETNAAARAGFETAGLGARILRAETAAIAAVAIVQSRWGDLG